MTSEMQELAETAWEEFRARYHATVDASKNGGDGSTGLNGDGILQVRSVSPRVARSVHWLTERLNGSGDLPDTETLLSYAANEGQSAEDFTCTVLSAMFLMDGIYSIHSGKKDMVVQMFNAFMNEKEPRITLESTPLKTRGPVETTPSPAPVDVSNPGPPDKRDSTKQSAPLKKGKLVKGSGTPLTSGPRKAPPKK
jgi:hypothetical protein